VVLGGLGTNPGAVYGSVLLVFLPTRSADLAARMELSRDIFANVPLAIYGAVLVVAMLAFPAGIQGGVKRLVRTFR
jgi:branched-chain amino acid transport system permease protein